MPVEGVLGYSCFGFLRLLTVLGSSKVDFIGGSLGRQRRLASSNLRLIPFESFMAVWMVVDGKI